MRRGFTLLCLTSLLAPAAFSEIIDRIAVSVGSRVITEADLDREIRITALLNSTKPDFSAANKRQTAERMVDQMLIRAELEASRYRLPPASDADTALQEEKTRFGDEAAFRRALAEYGVSEEDLKARLTWQITLLRFIDIRFRPGIQVTDDEIRTYFNDHVRAGIVQAHPGQTPSIDDYRDGIEQTLISQASNTQVEQWLKEARRRTRIQFHDEVFQ